MPSILDFSILDSSIHFFAFTIFLSFIMAHFTYCSSVWNNCLETDSDKLEIHVVNKRALRYVYNDFSSEYDRLTNKMTLSCRHCQDMLIIGLLTLRDNVKNLRGVNK